MIPFLSFSLNWNRDPDSPGPNPPMDPLFMEKFENIVGKIVSSSGASLMSVLPSPIPASTATSAPVSLQWAKDELIKNRVGKVNFDISIRSAWCLSKKYSSHIFF